MIAKILFAVSGNFYYITQCVLSVRTNGLKRNPQAQTALGLFLLLTISLLLCKASQADKVFIEDNGKLIAVDTEDSSRQAVYHSDGSLTDVVTIDRHDTVIFNNDGTTTWINKQ